MANDRGGHQATAEERGIELMKQMLLPSKAVPKSLKESAGKRSCCIFRVSQALAGGNAKACWPRIVPIGPYHHGETQLQMLEEHKWRYLQHMLDRIQPQGIGLEDLINVLTPKEEMIRQCYSESTDCFSGLDLVNMMVLDGCFIIELLLRTVTPEASDFDDPLLANSYVFASLVRDLLRLENQVPYFVLKDLFETMRFPNISLPDLASCFFNCVMGSHVPVRERCHSLRGVHLLDSFRLWLIPCGHSETGARESLSNALIGSASKLYQDRISFQSERAARESSSNALIDSASKLYQSGIKFKQGEGSTFLEIKFDVETKTVMIPELTISDTLNCILLNMVAFEQCYVHCDMHVTAYAKFMGCLIQTGKDAQLLHDDGVIRHNGMSKDDVARFFGEVCKDASWDIQQSYLASEIAGVNESQVKYRVFLFRLTSNYFGKPWAFVSVVYSIVMLIGLVYTVLQYYDPK